MLYVIIITTTIILSIGSAVLDSLLSGEFSLLYAFLAPSILIVSCGLLLGFADLIIRILPKKVWNPQRFPFAVSKKELSFYERIGIRKWKDKAVPELGASAGFSKKNLQSSDAEYLERFIRETCQGEALHFFGAVFAFIALAFYPVRVWYFVLLILFVNFFINILPVFIQRFNRYRLCILYKMQARRSAKLKTEESVREGVEVTA
jgi:glycosyl-4,4'-diaponeurosporenoate acyltransferase